MKRFYGLVLAIVVVLLVSSCARTPEESAKRAGDALEEAEAAGAQRYAPEAWSRAQQAMDRLDAELAAQAEKFRLFRSFKAAENLADEAVAAANQARAEAENRKAQLRAEVDRMIAEVKTSLQSARNQLAALPASVRVSTATLRSRLDEAGRLMDAAQLEMDGQRYDRAMATAAEARDEIVEVLKAIERVAPPPAVKKR
jgi:hypothetical protein